MADYTWTTEAERAEARNYWIDTADKIDELETILKAHKPTDKTFVTAVKELPPEVDWSYCLALKNKVKNVLSPELCEGNDCPGYRFCYPDEENTRWIRGYVVIRRIIYNLLGEIADLTEEGKDIRCEEVCPEYKTCDAEGTEKIHTCMQELKRLADICRVEYTEDIATGETQ